VREFRQRVHRLDEVELAEDEHWQDGDVVLDREANKAGARAEPHLLRELGHVRLVEAARVDDQRRALFEPHLAILASCVDGAKPVGALADQRDRVEHRRREHPPVRKELLEQRAPPERARQRDRAVRVDRDKVLRLGIHVLGVVDGEAAEVRRPGVGVVKPAPQTFEALPAWVLALRRVEVERRVRERDRPRDVGAHKKEHVECKRDR
jgi:hypothetical protein